MRRIIAKFVGAAAAAVASLAAWNAAAQQACDFNDSHFHLTNYIQEGPSAAEVLRLMGPRVCRSTLFGIPLQQEWSHTETGDFAPASTSCRTPFIAASARSTL